MTTPEYQLRNLLMLEQGVHSLWGKSLFALKPLPSIEPGEMLVEFRWLHQNTPGSVTHVRGQSSIILDDRPAVPRRIQTGDKVRLISQDPDKYPLPDPLLLNLQFHMNILCRACAGAGSLELIFYQDYPPPGAPDLLAGDNLHRWSGPTSETPGSTDISSMRLSTRVLSLPAALWPGVGTLMAQTERVWQQRRRLCLVALPERAWPRESRPG